MYSITNVYYLGQYLAMRSAQFVERYFGGEQEEYDIVSTEAVKKRKRVK